MCENQITSWHSGVGTTRPLYRSREIRILCVLVLDLHRLGMLDSGSGERETLSVLLEILKLNHECKHGGKILGRCMCDTGQYIRYYMLFLERPVDLKMQRYV